MRISNWISARFQPQVVDNQAVSEIKARLCEKLAISR